MKSVFTLFALFFCFLFSTAQVQVPGYGKLDKADLEMKNCSFDKDAGAMVLFDVGEVYCNLNLDFANAPLRTELTRHVRIKILNTKGLDEANIRIPYFSMNNMEDIKDLSAQTITLDDAGNMVFTKVEKDAIFRKKINKRVSEVIFTFSNVKPGCILEYKYRDDASDLNAFRNWYFQKSIPVAFSRYILNFPPELVVSASAKGGLPIEATDDMKVNRNIKTYTMKNVPALRDEAFITCDEDYLQQVSPMVSAIDLPGVPRRSLLRSWPGIIRQLMEDEDFGLQLKKNIPRTSDLDAMLNPVSDPYKKMVIIHEYVRKNMLWDKTMGIWALDGVKSAWKDKKGTSGEINLILVNLLKDANLDAHPVLVSTRDNGRINTFEAGFYQFNKVLAYVKINNRMYVLDATDKYTPANLIPYEVINSEGLVIEKLDTYQWGWVNLWNEDQLFKNTVILSGVIDESGNLKGEASVTSSQYSRLERMKTIKENKEKFVDTWLTPVNKGMKVDSLNFQNEEADSLPLVQLFQLSQKLNASGDYNYFSINHFAGLDKNPFIADERFSDVFFGANQNYTIIGELTIPQNYQFETLPKNIKMIMPDTSIVFFRTAEVHDDVLSFRVELQFKQPYYSFEDYGYFKEFYKKLFDLLNEQYVYKKK